MENQQKQWLTFWREEKEAAYLYSQMAENEKSAKMKEFYTRLADIENRHALVWENRLKEQGGHVPEYKHSFRARMLAFVGKKFGNKTLVETLNANEDGATSAYANIADVPEAQNMAKDEKAHSKALQTLLGTKLDASSIASSESTHKSSGGNALRAGVMGANDGLVSNFCLVMGMAGASEAANAGGSKVLLMTGIAGLLAGAISMALGEWLSVQSSRELYTKQMALEKAELEGNAEEEIEELSLIYQAKGLSQQEARHMAEKMALNQNAMLDTLAREELGVNPEELGGSAWEAAFTSFLLFAIGAIIPVLPFFFSISNTLAIGLSAGLSFMGLFGLGAAITLMTGRSVWYSGFRQVLFGILASLVTFAIGHLIGVSVA